MHQAFGHIGITSYYSRNKFNKYFVNRGFVTSIGPNIYVANIFIIRIPSTLECLFIPPPLITFAILGSLIILIFPLSIIFSYTNWITLSKCHYMSY